MWGATQPCLASEGAGPRTPGVWNTYSTVPLMQSRSCLAWAWCQRLSASADTLAESGWYLMNSKRALTNRKKKHPTQIPKPVSWKVFQDQHILIH